VEEDLAEVAAHVHLAGHQVVENDPERVGVAVEEELEGARLEAVAQAPDLLGRERGEVGEAAQARLVAEPPQLGQRHLELGAHCVEGHALLCVLGRL